MPSACAICSLESRSTRAPIAAAASAFHAPDECIVCALAWSAMPERVPIS
jgi:hypothetical protein